MVEAKRDTHSLDFIYSSFKQTTFNTTPKSPNENFIAHLPRTLEEELMSETIKVYLDETKRKANENLQRKSPKIISDNLILM